MPNTDPSGIAFIVCTNNVRYMEECRYYIDRLHVPEGIHVTVEEIRGARSMTAGYNAAMRSSDAKYKVYLHQDMFLINREFIRDLLACMQGTDAPAMVGVAGAVRLPDADAWKRLDIGGCISIGTFSGAGSIAVKPGINDPDGLYGEVEFIDGMLMATSADLEWDERIEGFHFYDVSQCLRFRNAGYRIAVAHQGEIWTFHDFGPLNLATYRRNQLRFCELYDYPEGDGDDSTEIYEMCDTVAAAVRRCFDRGQFDQAREILTQAGGAVYFNQDLLTAAFALEIQALEEIADSGMFLENGEQGSGFALAESRWLELRLLLIRAVFGDETAEKIAERIIDGAYSVFAVIVGILHNVPEEYMDSLLDGIAGSLERRGLLTPDVWEQTAAFVRKYEAAHLPSAEGL